MEKSQKKKETAAELEARFAEQKERWKQRIKAARAAEKKASDAKLIELGRHAEAIQQEIDAVTRQRDALYAFVTVERTNSNGEKYSYWQRFEREHPEIAAEMQKQS